MSSNENEPRPLTLQEWDMNRADFSRLPLCDELSSDFEQIPGIPALGAGAEAQVYAARFKSQQTPQFALYAKKLYPIQSYQGLRANLYASDFGIGPKVYEQKLCINPEDKLPYVSLVMENVKGLNLAKFLETEPSPAEKKKARILLRNAIERLHEGRFVHRDLGTPNILIVLQDGHVVDVKLIDYSLSGMTPSFDPSLLRVELDVLTPLGERVEFSAADLRKYQALRVQTH